MSFWSHAATLNKNGVGLHVKCRYYFQILIKLEYYRQIFEKYSNTKFHEKPSCGSWVVARGRSDMKKLLVPFRNFPNAPKNDTRSRWNDKGGIIQYL